MQYLILDAAFGEKGPFGSSFDVNIGRTTIPALFTYLFTFPGSRIAERRSRRNNYYPYVQDIQIIMRK